MSTRTRRQQGGRRAGSLLALAIAVLVAACAGPGAEPTTTVPATSSTTVATTVATTPEVSAAGAFPSRGAFFRFPNTNRPALKVRVVQGINCCLAFLTIRHLDESESPGTSSVPVHDDPG